MNYGDDYEPTEFEYEMITEPFWQEMQKIITKEVDGRTKGLREMYRLLEERSKLENDKMRELKKQIREVGLMKESEIKEAYKQAELDVQHQITGGYHIGQILWQSDQKSKREKCTICDGKQKVEAVFRDTIIKIKCPKCDGYGHVITYWYEPKEMEIVYITFQKNKMVLSNSSYVNSTVHTDNDDSVPAKDAFITKEECEADCEMRNAIERANNK